ncbi:MAG: UDP-N-acetylmuramoyl-L-alanine--D-glutamate ligase [Ruminococcus sp.]
MKLEGKNVLVFGSGISGIGAADLLKQVGANPIIYDGNEELDREEIRSRMKDGAGTKVILGELSEEEMDRLDLVVLSPGVPTDLPVVKSLKARNLTIWGEVELAYQMGKGRVLAITGTNGKTTTTAMLGKIMEDYLDSVYVVGNIGTPYTSVALDMKEDTVTVAEISSFQLETIQDFCPQVSAILNITEDHLNRHHTMEEYIRVKEQITSNQTSDQVCVLNYEDMTLREFGKQIPARVVYFSGLQPLERGIYLDGEDIVLATEQEKIVITSTDRLKILGIHNYENTMAAAAMAYYAGVPVENIRRSIESFTAVEHRIEYVTEKNGVVYYNDSKGTNPDAAIKGIQAMNRPTLLIGGGYDKDSTYEEWIESFDGKVRYLVLIGQTREKIQEAAHNCGFKNTILAEDLEEAVRICAGMARKGDAVLLSPACASWGQFENYEQRGRMFKEYVYALPEETEDDDED